VKRPLDEASPWLAAIPYAMRIHRQVSCSDEWSEFIRDYILKIVLEKGIFNSEKETTKEVFSYVSAHEIDSVELQMVLPEMLNMAGYFMYDPITVRWYPFILSSAVATLLDVSILPWTCSLMPGHFSSPLPTVKTTPCTWMLEGLFIMLWVN